MIEIYALVGVALVVAGAVVGILTVLAVGIHREERARSMTIGSPSRAASGARTFNGTYARRPGVTQEPGIYRQDLALAAPSGPGP
jgi:hypothetical protein